MDLFELVKKKSNLVIRVFKYMGLKIEISSNLKIVNFLDVTFKFNDNSYKPFNKTNTILTYINVNCNHPTPIIQQIPNAINIIINRLSSSKMIFNNLKEIYKEALLNSGYKNELKYLETKKHNNYRDNYIEYYRTENININNIKNNKNRSRTISWFNLPFCKLSNINIGKYF